MSEFPDVRVDYFRPVNGLRPPLATFLSHIHSDHRAGLDTYMGAL
jgi:DNA cross-link repair 1C protein